MFSMRLVEHSATCFRLLTYVPLPTHFRLPINLPTHPRLMKLVFFICKRRTKTPTVSSSGVPNQYLDPSQQRGSKCETQKRKFDECFLCASKEHLKDMKLSLWSSSRLWPRTGFNIFYLILPEHSSCLVLFDEQEVYFIIIATYESVRSRRFWKSFTDKFGL